MRAECPFPTIRLAGWRERSRVPVSLTRSAGRALWWIRRRADSWKADHPGVSPPGKSGTSSGVSIAEPAVRLGARRHHRAHRLNHSGTRDRLRRIPELALSFSVLMGCACLTSEAATPDAPSTDAVPTVLEEALPGFWSVHRLVLSEPVDYGNAVEPDWRWRFEAAITPREALYAPVEKLGDVVLVERTLEPKASQQSMYGIARATFQAGSWKFELKLENRPFENQGQPRSFFKARTAVAGSEEERELRGNAHQRFVRDLEAQHARERTEAEERYRNELVAAGEAQRQRLAELETEHETALAAWKMELAARAERRREEIAADLELASINQDRMRKATASAGELSELAATTETTMAGLKTRLETLASQEAETLAATLRVVEARAKALQTLLGELDGAANAERYRIVLNTVSETDEPLAGRSGDPSRIDIAGRGDAAVRVASADGINAHRYTERTDPAR